MKIKDREIEIFIALTSIGFYIVLLIYGVISLYKFIHRQFSKTKLGKYVDYRLTFKIIKKYNEDDLKQAIKFIEHKRKQSNSLHHFVEIEKAINNRKKELGL